jgi:hypothetical protein
MPRVVKPRITALALALFLTPVASYRLDAQATAAAAIAFGGIDKFLDRIESADLYYGWNVFERRGSPSRYAVPNKDEFGIEFSFHVTSFGKERPWLVTRDSIKKLTEKPKEWKSTSLTVKKHLEVAGRDTIVTAVDSEFVAAPNKPDKIPQLVEMDFGIGYGQLNGVKKDQPYELRGYVRELPSVSVYVTRWLNEGLAVYIGGRTGVITLQDGQVFVPDGNTTKIFNVSATSFEVGVPVGFIIPFTHTDDAPSFTFELSPMWRNFNSVVPVPNTGVPTNLPHQMDLSGANFTIGVMFPIPGKNK